MEISEAGIGGISSPHLGVSPGIGGTYRSAVSEISKSESECELFTFLPFLFITNK